MLEHLRERGAPYAALGSRSVGDEDGESGGEDVDGVPGRPLKAHGARAGQGKLHALRLQGQEDGLKEPHGRVGHDRRHPKGLIGVDWSTGSPAGQANVVAGG
jgi:hypothetical protein